MGNTLEGETMDRRLHPLSPPVNWGNSAQFYVDFFYYKCGVSQLRNHVQRLFSLRVLDPGKLRLREGGTEAEALLGPGAGGLGALCRSSPHRGPAALCPGLIPFSAQLNSGEGLFLIPF